MKNVRLLDLSAPTKPSKVSIRQPIELDSINPTEKISSNNITVKRELASSKQKKEYLPIINKTLLDTLNVKREEFENGRFNVDLELSRVSNFNITDDIDLQGTYLQNVVKYPKFTLNTNIKTLPDVNFRFILSIKKDKSDANPQLYTSNKFYNELASSYWENNPYMVANAIKSEAVVSVVYYDFVEKIKNFRLLETSVGVVVNQNLFVDFDSTENLTLNFEELVRYIDWVVTKPARTYDERLIRTSFLGKWETTFSPTGAPSQPEPPLPTDPPISPISPPRPTGIGSATPSQGGTPSSSGGRPQGGNPAGRPR